MEYWCLFCSQLADRRAAVQKEFQDHDLDVNWWQSIHARSFGIVGIEWPPTVLADRPHGNHPGYVGLAIGYWTLWQHLLLIDRPGPFVIFEDDVILAESFKEKLDRACEGLPTDWQIVVLGNQYVEKKELHNHVAGDVYRFGEVEVLGTQATLFRKSALRFLMEANHHAELPIDDQLNKTSYRKIPSYLIMPGLAQQRSQLTHDDPRHIPFSCG